MKISPLSKINLNLKTPKPKQAALALGAAAIGAAVYNKTLSKKSQHLRTIKEQERTENQIRQGCEKFEYAQDIMLTSQELNKTQFKFGKNDVDIIKIKDKYKILETGKDGNLARVTNVGSDFIPVSIVEYKKNTKDSYEYDEFGDVTYMSLNQKIKHANAIKEFFSTLLS